MSKFLTINKASGRLRLMDSDSDISMVAKSGTPLYLNLRDPFIEAVIPPHLQVQVSTLPEEKMMLPGKVLRRTLPSFEEFSVHAGFVNDPPHELTAALGVFISCA